MTRRNVDYKSALARADALRRNDLDGRGILCNEGLIHFCSFIPEVCLDQMAYMRGLLRLKELFECIRRYVEFRPSGMIPGPAAEKGLRVESARIIQEILVGDEASSGSVIAASNLKKRTGRSLLGQLIREGLLISDTPKGDVRMGFPIHAAGWFFPYLYPTLSR